MKKITVDLNLMDDHRLSFDQYLVLYYLHTGDFETAEDHWNIFDQEAFETRFLRLEKPSVQSVMISLKHRKFIEMKGADLFRCVNKKLFKPRRAEKLTEKNIFSFREKNPVSLYAEGVPSPILNSCTKVKHWRSPGFINAWNVFEFDVRKISHGRPLDLGMAERLINSLIKLSGDSEPLATLIIQQSNDHSWRGFWPLDKSKAVQVSEKKAPDQKLAEWYGPKTSQV